MVFHFFLTYIFSYIIANTSILFVDRFLASKFGYVLPITHNEQKRGNDQNNIHPKRRTNFLLDTFFSPMEKRNNYTYVIIVDPISEIIKYSFLNLFSQSRILCLIMITEPLLEIFRFILYPFCISLDEKKKWYYSLWSITRIVMYGIQCYVLKYCYDTLSFE